MSPVELLSMNWLYKQYNKHVGTKTSEIYVWSDIIKANNRIKISGFDESVLQLTESTLRSDHH